jgi:hypothetical protein
MGHGLRHGIDRLSPDILSVKMNDSANAAHDFKLEGFDAERLESDTG